MASISYGARAASSSPLPFADFNVKSPGRVCQTLTEGAEPRLVPVRREHHLPDSGENVEDVLARQHLAALTDHRTASGGQAVQRRAIDR